MSATTEQLCSMTCKPCEGGVDPMTADEVASQMSAIDGWHVVSDGKAIEKKIERRNFIDCVAGVTKIAAVAEANDHHPDLHIEGYKNLRINMTTHAIGGLSENDFIVAAKIDALSL